MNGERHRGVFWDPTDDAAPIPGTLEVRDDGELRVEVFGSLPRRATGNEPRTLHAQLVKNPYGSAATLFHCFHTGGEFGSAGPAEKWLSERGLFGPEHLADDARFDRIALEVSGLEAFVGEAPPIFERAAAMANKHPAPFNVKRIAADGLSFTFEWAVSGKWGHRSLELRQRPRLRVQLTESLSVDDLVRRVVVPLELWFTLNQPSLARLQSVTVGPNTQLVGLRVPPPDDEAREPHFSELLFRLRDLAENGDELSRIRHFADRQHPFVVAFMSSERATDNYVEDRVQGELVALSHLAGELAQPVDELPSEPERSSYLPPIEVLALPRLLRHLLSPSVAAALEISSVDEFVTQVARSFRWASYLTGESPGGEVLVSQLYKLRRLTQLRALTLMGFERSAVEQRIADAFRRRGR